MTSHNAQFSASQVMAYLRKIAHDLRNPLSGITLSLDAISEACAKDENAKVYFNVLERSAQKLQVLADKISAASGAVPLHKTEVQFDLAVTYALQNLAISIPSGIEIRKNLNAGGAKTLLDEQKFSWVLAGLVENAVEASAGRSIVNVETLAEKHQAILRVTDSGIGMNAVELESACQPFFTTRSGKDGMGLTIALAIVQLHQGTLELQSDPGQGTIVTCRFPVH